MLSGGLRWASSKSIAMTLGLNETNREYLGSDVDNKTT